MISVTRLKNRRKRVACKHVAVDSGAYSIIEKYGYYPDSVGVYAQQILRLLDVIDGIDFVSPQDYMCESWILAKTGLDVAAHQRMTVERYDQLCALVSDSVYVLPVLQGYQPSEYIAHIRQYGERLAPGAWVGVGSVCRRNSQMAAAEAVIMAIHEERPDLRLHGFGLKTTALYSTIVQQCLYSADSVAWTWDARWARRHGDLTRSQNNWREAQAFADRVTAKAGSKQRQFQTSLWREL